MRVQNYIDFRNGVAAHRANVKGPMHPKGTEFFTHFLEDTLDTAHTSVSTPGSTDTVAINAAIGGHCRLTAATTDDDTCQLNVTGLNWEGDRNCLCEARIRINDVSTTALWFGFTDATSESNQVMPFHYPANTATSSTSDAVGFVSDPDTTTYTASNILCTGVASATKDTTVDTGVTWADGVWHVLRVELMAAADNASSTCDARASFYLDGDPVGTCVAATKSDTDLVPAVFAGRRTGDGSSTVDVDYVYVYQDLCSSTEDN